MAALVDNDVVPWLAVDGVEEVAGRGLVVLVEVVVSAKIVKNSMFLKEKAGDVKRKKVGHKNKQ